ncbi:MAG: CalY family protein [Firmicutes bacterium]|nr:CalY family protein [Bacillota bacterium]
MGKRYMQIIVLLIGGFILVLGFAYAFFSDNVVKTVSGTAGTVKLQPVILLTEQDPLDPDTDLAAAPIINWKPGDVTTIEWTVENAGNKSIYTLNSLQIAWDVSTDMPEQNIIYLYPDTMSDDNIRNDILNNNAGNSIDAGSDQNDITTLYNMAKGYNYQFSGNVLDGTGNGAEIGDARTPDSSTHNLPDGTISQTIRLKLAFSPKATNNYLKTSVYVNAVVNAAQFRNNSTP